MKGMLKRLGSLESLPTAPDSGRINLDLLTDDELNQLEAIIIKHESGLTLEGMSSDELRFVASLPVMS